MLLQIGSYILIQSLLLSTDKGRISPVYKYLASTFKCDIILIEQIYCNVKHSVKVRPLIFLCVNYVNLAVYQFGYAHTKIGRAIRGLALQTSDLCIIGNPMRCSECLKSFPNRSLNIFDLKDIAN